MTDVHVGYDEYGRPIFEDADGDLYVIDDSASQEDALLERLDVLEQQVAEQDAAAQQGQQLAHLEQQVESMLDAMGVPEHQRDLIVRNAVALAPTPDGLPDIEQAVLEYQHAQELDRKPPPNRPLPDDATRAERDAWCAERAEQLAAAADAQAPAPVNEPIGGDAWDSMTNAQRGQAMFARLEDNAA